MLYFSGRYNFEEIIANMLTVKNTFKLLDVVNKYFNNGQDSRTFVFEIEEIMDNKIDLKMNDFATRRDLAELRGELKSEMVELKTELRSDFNRLDACINLNLAYSTTILERSQKEQLKWLIGAMVAIMSLAVAVIKLF